MTLVEIDRLARKAHEGQVRKFTGQPYIWHSRRVAIKQTTERRMAIGLLHDVIEDTELTAEDLLQAGVEPEVVVAVEILTRREDETYSDFIERIAESGNDDAIAVKLADINDNLSDLPADNVLRVRYGRALGRLYSIMPEAA